MDNKIEAPYQSYFYDAMRSGNIDLLKKLFDKFDVFLKKLNIDSQTRRLKLEETLSQVYEELKLKNVELPEDVEIYVESMLIKFRFFSDTLEHEQNDEEYRDNIRQRVELLLENINLLEYEYSKEKNVDEKFLFIVKFIAQNIHVLKQRLKSTYNRIPWEEMEFCLICFVSSYIKYDQEINLFFLTTFSKGVILEHLITFKIALRSVRNNLNKIDITEVTDVTKLNREKIVKSIIKRCPQFEKLYKNHQQIRDIYSIQKIQDYIKLAKSVNPQQKDKQLIVIRSLQVIGEYLKNTLESPNLSSDTSDLLLITLPMNTRKIMIDFRSSMSHIHSLNRRVEIEENMDVRFIIDVQNDLQEINKVVTNILHKMKFKVAEMLWKKIRDTDSLDEIKKVSEILGNVNLDKNILEDSKVMTTDPRKLEKLVEEFKCKVTDKTAYEECLFKEIDEIMNPIMPKIMQGELFENYYASGSSGLHGMKYPKVIGVNCNTIKIIKNTAKTEILDIDREMIESSVLKNITDKLLKILKSAKLRIDHKTDDELHRLIAEVILVFEFGTDDHKCNEKLREKFNEKNSLLSLCQKRTNLDIYDTTYYNKLLKFKQSELKRIWEKYRISDKLDENRSGFRGIKQILTIMEILVLDIMSILGHPMNLLENNHLYLDETIPLLTGKCLRNHLAHVNALYDISMSDPSLAVVLNAEKLIEKNTITSKKKLGKLLRDDATKVADKCRRSLLIITNQEKLLVAIEEGCLGDVKRALKSGADVNARTSNLWTALHFAARRPNLEVVRCILNQNIKVSVKDLDCRTPLHIAAAYGRKSIVEFFVQEAKAFIDDYDIDGKTPLHLASENGHIETVEILLKNNANTNIVDKYGSSPIRYALRNNHVEIVKIILDEEKILDINEISNGLTALQCTTETGNLELVNLLIEKGAYVNLGGEKGTPLLIAVTYGYPEVVDLLISKSAHVEATIHDGHTSLHFAAMHGHTKIAQALVAHNAKVNAVEENFNLTPLHYAAQNGHEEIVNFLLKGGSHIEYRTNSGISPLHLAAQKGHLKVVDTLLKNKANIHVSDNLSTSPLHLAALGGHKEVCELLLKNGADVNIQTQEGRAPLHNAAKQSQKDVVKFLIEQKAEINIRDIYGYTPLHAAAIFDSRDIINILIEHNAEIDARANQGTPLHVAVIKRCKNAIMALIENKALIDSVPARDFTILHSAIAAGDNDIVNLIVEANVDINAIAVGNITPLHLAVIEGNLEIVSSLIANGADVKMVSNDVSPLHLAIMNNDREIVQILTENIANDDIEGSEFIFAVKWSSMEVVDILLKNKDINNIKDDGDNTLLHFAANRGNRQIVNGLIERGANVNAKNKREITPLHVAAEQGYDDVAEVLILHGAIINIECIRKRTPLHEAASFGHAGVIKFLLDNEAILNIRDGNGRTPLELAVLKNHFQAVKTILQHDNSVIDIQGYNGDTVLHIAAEENNLPMAKLLVDEGSNMNIINDFKAKPIHTAVTYDHKDIVDLFLSRGMNINECGVQNMTLLQYAVHENKWRIVRYLAEHGADLNSKNDECNTAMHIAAAKGYVDIIKILLNHGAIYNPYNKNGETPCDVTGRKFDAMNVLEIVEGLFEDAERNKMTDVMTYTEETYYANARNEHGETALHIAARKGNERLVRFLLLNNANPNLTDNDGHTPLHCAVMYSHYKVMLLLLSRGGIYNALSKTGKIPSSLSTDKKITYVFHLISRSFLKVMINDSSLIEELHKVNDPPTLTAVMGTRSRENRTLVVEAIHKNFPQIANLRRVLKSDLTSQIDTRAVLFSQGNNYEEILDTFKRVYNERKELLGPDNIFTLDIEFDLPTGTCIELGRCEDSLRIFEEIYEKQKVLLGADYEDTLRTRCNIAKLMYMTGKYEEALTILEEVFSKQKKFLGLNHPDSLITQYHLAVTLDFMGYLEEALITYTACFKSSNEKIGKYYETTILSMYSMGMVMGKLAKYKEAEIIFKDLYERQEAALGVQHMFTMKTLYSYAGLKYEQNRYNEAIEKYEALLCLQNQTLPRLHGDTLLTLYRMGDTYLVQAKFVKAYEAYKDYTDRCKGYFDLKLQKVDDIDTKIEKINLRYDRCGKETDGWWAHLQRITINAVTTDDLKTLTRYVKEGVEINFKDGVDGRTPLHSAIFYNRINIFNFLLENGADVTLVTKKNETPLHIAVAKGNTEIVNTLLDHMKKKSLVTKFIDARTSTNGSTALHIAVEGGYVEIVRCLLKHGAIYNMKNSENKLPIELSKNREITFVLKLINKLFKVIEFGNVATFGQLETVSHDEYLAITNARNKERNTLLRAAAASRRQNIIDKLLAIHRNK